MASTDSHHSNSFSHEIGGDESLFEKISEAGYQRYGTEPARVLYEELALSVASLKLFEVHGPKVSKVPLLRHLLVFGPTAHFKSQITQDFRQHFLPGTLNPSQLDASTPRALLGSVDTDAGEVFPPEFTTKDFVQVEWDTLTTMEKYEAIAGVFYKALEDSVIRNDMVSVAKTEIDDGDLLAEMEDWGVEKDGFRLEFPVESVIVGVVHLESEFWKKFDKAFYNRWLPIYLNQPEGYIGKARRNSERLDEDETEIQRGFRAIFDQTPLTSAFKSVNDRVYETHFREALGFESPRVFNKMNLTLSCKALLEGHIEDGEIQPSTDDVEWLKDRMQSQYGPHYREMESYIDANPTNERRRADRLETQLDVVEYVSQNSGATVRELADELGRPRGTVSDYLTKNESRLSDMLVQRTEMTNRGRKPVYRLSTSTENDE